MSSPVETVTPTATASETESPSTITSAPSGSSTASATGSSSSRAPQVHTVKAGSGGFKFEPAELTDIPVGDTITFEFYPPDHSVARAEFKSPCVPYEYTGKDKVGFWSDTQWVDTVEDVSSLLLSYRIWQHRRLTNVAHLFQRNRQLNRTHLLLLCSS